MQTFNYNYRDGVNPLRDFVGQTNPGPQKSHLRMTELGTPIIRTVGQEDIYITKETATLTKHPDGSITVEQ